MHYPSVSLIIPCYNESARIALMFDGIRAFAGAWKGNYEIIIVDDGSDDGTEILTTGNPFFFELKKADRVSFLRQQNTGKGGALQTGIRNAKNDFVLTLDADMASSPLELIQWLQMRGGFANDEILIASRELHTSRVKDSLKRKVIGNIFNFIIRQAVNLNITDTQCGFKLYPLGIAKQLFAELKTKGWAHDVEILLKAKQMGCDIVEMPVKWDAIPGSKINVLKDSWRMFWEVVRIRKEVGSRQ